nr:Ribosomal protein L5 domain protein [Bacillus wiedmannii]
MKRKYVLLLFAMLLASCGQVEQKKETKKVEETVNEVKETIGVTVIQKNIKRKSYRNQKLS